jgi:hypothetical protein
VTTVALETSTVRRSREFNQIDSCCAAIKKERLTTRSISIHPRVPNLFAALMTHAVTPRS